MTSFSWRRAGALARKEVFHILRDPFTLGLALVLPIFMVVMFGLAIEFNVRNITLAASDWDRTQSSRQLLDVFGSSRYFVMDPVHSPSEAFKSISGEHARGALIVPPRFEKDLLAGRGVEAQVLVDGSDSSTVGPILNYLTRIQDTASERIAGDALPRPYDLRTRFLYNPELNSRWFVVPGLVVVNMATLAILLTALAVAREWESGAMELLLSTPVQPLEIMIGKLAPYGALGIIAALFVFIIARVGFRVPFVGNPLVFGSGFLLFLFAYLAQGLLISVLTRKQQVAMQIAFMSGLLPSSLLSGFIFPIESMPPFFQYFTMILPARWLMQISRESFLKGAGLFEMSEAFVALFVLCVVMIAIAIRRFKRDLEP